MKFNVLAELKGQSYLSNGIEYAIFTKEFEIMIPEETIINRAFNQHREFAIKHTGIDLIVCGCNNRNLNAIARIGRCQSSDRVFKRLQELGWKFCPIAAKKMWLPLPSTRVRDHDEFFWERLVA